MQDIEEAIRERAYHLWRESGAEHGNADVHWLAAQREVVDASLGSIGHVTNRTKAARAKSAPASRKKKRAS
jgi:hypothetical protein